MDNNKKVYVDSRYKTSDSVSNSDFKFEINEALDLPDNTYCYIDDICIPHTWYTVEDFNNTLHRCKSIYSIWYNLCYSKVSGVCVKTNKWKLHWIKFSKRNTRNSECQYL